MTQFINTNEIKPKKKTTQQPDYITITKNTLFRKKI